MKIVSRHIERDGSGRVTLSAEEDEDMYHIYNLIQPGDHLRAPAVRRVQNESSTGSIESHRVRLNLTIEVTKTSFDATGSSAPADPSTSAAAIASGAGAMGGSSGTGTSANGGGGGSGGGGGGAGQGATLQVSGRVVEENQHVKMGAFHTLDLERNRNFTIYKDEWDSVHLERLQDASDVGTRAEIAAIVLGDGE